MGVLLFGNRFVGNAGSRRVSLRNPIAHTLFHRDNFPTERGHEAGGY